MKSFDVYVFFGENNIFVKVVRYDCDRRQKGIPNFKQYLWNQETSNLTGYMSVDVIKCTTVCHRILDVLSNHRILTDVKTLQEKFLC